ncbi:MAG: 2-oxoglutarate dehydrogenase, E2 component, dihydrolipoamide succinyltransferase [Acidobacteria bacterium]|nr:2-oxoglutarate dehydrogenase, E2 component, dihydrolipoamide succinyltransferase [Acidobacteriota bacterium]
MRVEVIMPQMGESIAEGTITKWLKQIGESVARDEPLFEISTDKVDAEIPSPAAGILVAVEHRESETVPINTVVAWLETDAAAAESVKAKPPVPKPSDAAAAPPAAAVPAVAPMPKSEKPVPPPPEKTEPAVEDESTRSSPLVRKMAAEHGIDLNRIQGTGLGSRVTKRDIMSYLENQETGARPAAPPPPPSAAAPSAVTPNWPGERAERVPMSTIRKKTAEHMVMSRRTSAHVTTVFEVDLTRVAKVREPLKELYLRQEGLKLTYLPFIAKAVIDALKAYPIVNSSVVEESILFKKDVNLGIAVALDWGLIVPVIKRADEKSLLGLSRSISELADRARSKQLKPDEVQGGTFTITNPGVYGSLFGTPIINQPQVAILGVGAVTKRPVVIDDAIAIRSMVYLALSFDHRIIDGAVADQFMAHIKRYLESPDSTYD